MDAVLDMGPTPASRAAALEAMVEAAPTARAALRSLLTGVFLVADILAAARAGGR